MGERTDPVRQDTDHLGQELESSEGRRSVSPTSGEPASADGGFHVGSLFSGVGGFDLGLERAGMRVLWQVEYDQQCQTVLRSRFPGTEVYGNVREVGGQNSEHAGESTTTVQQLPKSSEPYTGRRGPVGNDSTGRTALARVDLICGGFPCQDLSVAGKRAGLAGDRSGLWHEFRRIIGEITPRWVLIENVPGLLSSNGGRDLAIVLSGLAQLGYGWSYRILDSQYFGVPQRRRRVFIVGCLGDAGSAFRALHPEQTCLPGYPAPSRETRARIAEGSLSRALSRVGGGDDPGANKGAPIVTQEVADPIYTNEQRTWTHEGNTFRTRNVSATPLPRRLTPKECERLQGFPDDWTQVEHNGKPMPDGPRYRMMGNAVTTTVAEWIGRRILAVEEE